MAKKKKPQVRAPQPRARSEPFFSRIGRKPLYVLAIGLAAAIAAVLIVVSSLGGGKSKSSTELTGVGRTQTLFAGIPQRGRTLGSPSARVTLVEYGDFQCPVCKEWALSALPAVVRNYVRPGKVRMEFRGLSFIGSDSVKALAAALAAGNQDRFWQVADLLYENQGAEHSGWVSDGLLDSIATAIGLDTARFDADRSSAGVSNSIDRMTREASAAGISSTPSFLVGRTGGALTRVEITSLDVAGIRPALERALRG